MQTIRQLAIRYDISARTLRYYEEIGLITSVRSPEYAYRMYEDDTIRRLQQIIILRKLRIPLKEIKTILLNDNAALAVASFQKKILELDTEIEALTTVRTILDKLLQKFKSEYGITSGIKLLDDDSVKSIMDSLQVVKNNLKEDITMEKLKKADKTLSQLKDVRIIYVPPFTVASIRKFDGEKNAEHYAFAASHEFIKNHNIPKLKPDFRCFGFNHDGDGVHGYEVWVTIPEHMEVETPYEKKYFEGGLYAAHMIPEDGNFDDWDLLYNWVSESKVYEVEEREPRGMDGWLEEHYDTIHLLGLCDKKELRLQIDLLMPIKKKSDQEVIDIGYIEDSENKCGYKANLITKDKVRIIGYTKILQQGMCETDFRNELISDGRLEYIKTNIKKGTPILGFGSYDSECHMYKGSYRYTICVDTEDVADMDQFETSDMYIKKIPASKWVQFEMSLETFLHKFKPESRHHQLVQLLGYKFNGPVSGHFDVFCDGIIEFEDSQKDIKVYFWMPVK